MLPDDSEEPPKEDPLPLLSQLDYGKAKGRPGPGLHYKLSFAQVREQIPDFLLGPDGLVVYMRDRRAPTEQTCRMLLPPFHGIATPIPIFP